MIKCHFKFKFYRNLSMVQDNKGDELYGYIDNIAVVNAFYLSIYTNI